MTETEAAEVVGIIGTLSSRTLLEPTQQLYIGAVRDLDYRLTIEALEDWVKTRTDAPAISELREIVARYQFEDAGIDVPDPDAAWGLVQHWYMAIGRYGDLPKTPRVVVETIRRIGWIEMCNSDRQDVLRAQFREAYKLAVQRLIDEARTAPGAVHAQVGEQSGRGALPEHAPDALRGAIERIGADLGKPRGGR